MMKTMKARALARWARTHRHIGAKQIDTRIRRTEQSLGLRY